MATTLVGIFDNYTDAQSAVQALRQAGVKQGDISIVRNEPSGKGYMTYGGANSKDYDTGTSIGDKITNFFDNIFGANDDSIRDERDLYSESATMENRSLLFVLLESQPYKFPPKTLLNIFLINRLKTF